MKSSDSEPNSSTNLKIKLLIVDIDGTLTDGVMFRHDSIASFARNFQTKDLMGLELLSYSGVKIIALSSSDKPFEWHLSRTAPYMQVVGSVRDKCGWAAHEYIHYLAGDNREHIDWESMSAIGDDLNDLALLERVGVAGCPYDAVDVVKRRIDLRKDGYVMDRCGGEGAVREFCQLIHSLNGTSEEDLYNSHWKTKVRH